MKSLKEIENKFEIEEVTTGNLDGGESLSHMLKR